MQTVYFTSLNNDKEKIIKELNNASKFIRSMLIKKKIEMRIIPELNFKYDESSTYGSNIDNIINNLHKEH